MNAKFTASERQERLPEPYLNVNPTVKPARLVADPHLTCTAQSELILDAFFERCTILAAGERAERGRRGLQIDLPLVATTIRRWHADTGDDTLHVETGWSFFQISSTPGGRDV